MSIEKVTIIAVAIMACVGIICSTLSDSTDNKKYNELKSENEELKIQVAALQAEVTVYKAKLVETK